jgi:hypothetical protein
MLLRRLSALLTVVSCFALGCASAPAPSPPAPPRPLADVRQLAIVSAGASNVALVEHRSEPGRTLDEILAWHPYGAALRPLASLVHRGINSVLKVDQQAALNRALDDVAPADIVVEAMARRLRAAGSFDDVRTPHGEPVGDERRAGEAVIRVTVTAWGVVRVRGGDPDLFSSFSDVAATAALPGTGAIAWEHQEDVTGTDRLPPASFRKDARVAREQIRGALERAGERLAAELLYARGAAR